MSEIRRSVIFSVIDKYLAQILLLVTTAVMARILTPAETGLYVVANSVILLADNFRTFGVGIFIVQTTDVRRETLQSAFTLTLLLSISVMVVIIFTSDAIAGFYGAQELGELLRLAALGFLAVPFATPIVALLQRELAFGALAVINVAAATVASVVTIVLGSSGVGPSSYVWGFLASGLVLAILAVVMRPNLWIFRPCLAEARQMLSFGAVSSSVTLVNMAYELLPRIALGKILTFDAVGLYSRAVTVCQLPDRAVVSAMQPVVLPVMAERARSGGDLKDSYLRGHSLMSAIQWPMLIMLALLADPVVRLLLGPQWGEATPLVRMIAMANMALAPAFMTFPVLVTAGRIRDTLLSSLISLPPSILIVIGAAHISLNAVAASLLVVAPMQMLIALLFIRRAIGMRWSELFRASRASLAMAAGTAALPVLIIALLPNGLLLGWGEAALVVLAGATGWIITLFWVKHPIRHELLAVWRMLSAKAGATSLGRSVAALGKHP